MAKRDRRLREWHRTLPILALCIASCIAGAYAALALATADLANWGIWTRDFAKSPGAAAFAAVIAASIAFEGISRQVAVSRSALDHERTAASNSAWWQTFEWASSRALPSGEKDLPLPDSVTISTLQSLSQTATTKVQEIACAGVIDALTSRVVSIPDGVEESSEVSELGTSAAFDALASYVEVSDGTPAASPRAEAAVYERNVLSALTTLSSDARVFREPTVSGSRVDAIAEIAGAQVAVEVSFARTPLVVRARIRSAAQYRRLETSIPLVLVSRFPPPFSPQEEAEMRVVVAQWNTPHDNSRLLETLRRASGL